MGASFVRANGLRFAYVAAGPSDGPLALCLHGFPDHALTWRHLLPALADAGYRAVAPWLRGYAPTEVPARRDVHIDTLTADANALHRALGGDRRALLVGHDWGAVIGYRAGAVAPERWRRLVTLAVPPEPALAAARGDAGQWRRSAYMLSFQVPGAEHLLVRNDLAAVERLWRRWSPGYELQPEDREPLWATLTSPGTMRAALDYYRVQRRVLLRGEMLSRTAPHPPQATLYLHGADDGCIDARYAEAARDVLHTPGSRVEIVDGAGHFLHLERPDHVAAAILAFAQS